MLDILRWSLRPAVERRFVGKGTAVDGCLVSSMNIRRVKLPARLGCDGVSRRMRVVVRAQLVNVSNTHGSRAAKARGINVSAGASGKEYDLVTLSNLCVDAIVPCEALPPSDDASRERLLKQLADTPPPIEAWEVGGNTNTLIAARRLGMQVGSIGHVGFDSFGDFLKDVLEREGVKMASSIVDDDLDHAYPTLVCFVLVDQTTSEHAFCSRYDFGPWPLFHSVTSLPEKAKKVLSNTRSVFINGFVFDEIPEDVVVNASKLAQAHGAAVLFDPGPRSWTFGEGPRRHALESMLDTADIVLMTAEEAEVVVGQSDPSVALKRLMERPNSNAKWCIIKLGADGAILGDRSSGKVYYQEGYRVEVEDTVGCGDSFAAAISLGYTYGHNIVSTLALAGAVGAGTAMGIGAGRNVADMDRVVAILEKHAHKIDDDKIRGARMILESCQNDGGYKMTKI